MQPVHKMDYFSYQLSDGNDQDNLPVKEKKIINVISQDEEIDNMSVKDLKELCKNQKYHIISKTSENLALAQELESTKSMAKKALQDMSSIQSVRNLQDNRDNRRDFHQMNTQNFICTAGRIFSVVASVVGLVLTILFFVL